MSSATPRIPIVILIFNDNGNIQYRAFSPANWNLIEETSHPEFELQYGQFIARVYNHIVYDTYNSIQFNQTNYGRLLEVHSRNTLMPVVQRGNVIYCTTYDHPYCNYRPINRQSPIFFDYIEASNYASINQNLTHIMVEHEIV